MLSLKIVTDELFHPDLRDSFQYFISGSESVLVVMERLVSANVNRLVIVDDDHKVVGIVTVSDFIHFLVLRHSSTTPSNRNRRASKIGQSGEFSLGENYELDEESWKHMNPEVVPSPKCSPPPMWFQVP